VKEEKGCLPVVGAHYQAVDTEGKVLVVGVDWGLADDVGRLSGKEYVVEPMPSMWTVQDVMLPVCALMVAPTDRMGVYNSVSLLKGYDVFLQSSKGNVDYWKYYDTQDGFVHVWYSPDIGEDGDLPSIRDALLTGNTKVLLVVTEDNPIAKDISLLGLDVPVEVYRKIGVDTPFFSREIVGV
jgi:hypothetical protein